MARVLSDETTLSRQRKGLARESGVLRHVMVGEITLAVALGLAGAVLWFRDGQQALLWVAGVVAFLAAGHFLKARENLKQADFLSAGLKGEVEVARMLADGLDNQYYVYNDLTIRSGLKRSQIDHLVVGPCGAVVIETKNWRGRIVGEEKDKAWQQYRFEDSPPRRVNNPILQNQRHADVLKAFLASHGAPTVPIIGLVVFTARKATLDIKNLTHAILWPNEMCEHIRWLPAASGFNAAALDQVVNRLQRCVK